MSSVLKTVKGNPPKSTIRHYRGDTFIRTYKFQDKNEEPRDISSSTFEFEVRVSEHQNDGEPLAKCTEFIKGQSDEAKAAGVAKDEVVVKISADDMDVHSGNWSFDFRETDGSGDRTTREAGKFIIKEDVSRK